MRSFKKRAEMGVGTLIVFIAMLLVAAVAAGVLIQTAGSLQEKALSTGSQAKGQIATNIRVVEVSATNGENGSVQYFEMIAKLAPGSNPIKIDQAIFTMNTYDSTATLKYRGVDNTLDDSVTGYNTYRTLQFGTIAIGTLRAIDGDLDDDGQVDYVSLMNGTHMQFNISNDGANIFVNVSMGGNVSSVPQALALTSTDIAKDGVTYGTIAISGTTNTANQLDADVNVTFVPENAGQGYFAVEYLQQGTNFVNGNLQRGDVIKVYFEAPRLISEDEEIRLNLIPKIGTATLTQFVAPEVISTERVYMYP